MRRALSGKRPVDLSDLIRFKPSVQITKQQHRIAAVMRRIRPTLAGESIEVGDITLDPVAHKVTRRGRTLQLGPTEYRLLKFFMESPGRVFSRGQLLDGVWGTESEIELRTVDVHIRRLRKAIEIEGAKDPVRTVRSAGYSLEA